MCRTALGYSMAIGDGDIVEIEFTARTKQSGILIDTTNEKVAEEEEVNTEGQKWGPRKIVIGENHTFKVVEDSIREKKVGDGETIQIPTADAFGEYDSEWVKTVSSDKIPKDDRYPGARTTIDNHQVQIETIVGKRARVNFNHPLAGEDIEYEYTIVKVVEDPAERAKSLIEIYVGVELEVQIEEEKEHGKTLVVESDPMLSFNQIWLFTKNQIANMLIEKIEVERVIIKETFEKIVAVEEE